MQHEDRCPGTGQRDRENSTLPPSVQEWRRDLKRGIAPGQDAPDGHRSWLRARPWRRDLKRSAAISSVASRPVRMLPMGIAHGCALPRGAAVSSVEPRPQAWHRARTGYQYLVMTSHPILSSWSWFVVKSLRGHAFVRRVRLHEFARSCVRAPGSAHPPIYVRVFRALLRSCVHCCARFSSDAALFRALLRFVRRTSQRGRAPVVAIDYLGVPRLPGRASTAWTYLDCLGVPRLPGRASMRMQTPCRNCLKQLLPCAVTPMHRQNPYRDRWELLSPCAVTPIFMQAPRFH